MTHSLFCHVLLIPSCATQSVTRYSFCHVLLIVFSVAPPHQALHISCIPSIPLPPFVWHLVVSHPSGLVLPIPSCPTHHIVASSFCCVLPILSQPAHFFVHYPILLGHGSVCHVWPVGPALPMHPVMRHPGYYAYPICLTKATQFTTSSTHTPHNPFPFGLLPLLPLGLGTLTPPVILTNVPKCPHIRPKPQEAGQQNPRTPVC